ncbi:MAG: TRAP transporter substrate-binding protein DctP [Cucumibacter sp.]
MSKITKSLAAAAIGVATLFSVASGLSQETLRFSAVFSEQDIRADMTNMFAEKISSEFSFEPYFGGTLFAQGTELVELQRGNLEMGNIAPQDFANQIPAFSVLTSAYLFRDSDHLKTFWESEVGAQFKQMAEEQLGVHILGATYFGTRQVGLRVDRHITTPADMAGIKLRMPGGDAWQFLGSSLGANPTPMAYAEVYTGLQTGAIDGQDNPLPNVENMKFYEVMSQIVLTSHLIGYDLWTISSSAWDAMTPEQQELIQTASDEAIAWSTEQHLAREVALVDQFRGAGLEIYEPDVAAFRAHAQEQYLASDFAASWPEGVLDQINAL